MKINNFCRSLLVAFVVLIGAKSALAAAADPGCAALGGNDAGLGTECQITSFVTHTGTFNLGETLRILGNGRIDASNTSFVGITLNITGDLILETPTVATGGQVEANDNSTATSASPITINVSGDVLMQAGSAILAENTISGGSGGDISITVGGDMTMCGQTAVQPGCGAPGGKPGALISARNLTATSAAGGGHITITVGNTATATGAFYMEGGVKTYGTETGAKILSTAALRAGDISVTSGGTYFTEPGSVVEAGGPTGNGTSNQQGAKIFLVSDCGLTTQGRVTSKGPDLGADLVHLESCTVLIQGLVESTGKGHAANTPNSCDNVDDGLPGEVLRPGKPANATGCIEVWGNVITIDSTNGWAGELNSDIGGGGSGGTSWIDIFANSQLTVLDGTGNDRLSDNLGSTYLSTYAAHANSISGSDNTPGVVTALVKSGPLTASGKAFEASTTLTADTGHDDAHAFVGNGSDGGTINVEASGTVTLTGAFLNAAGDYFGGTPCTSGSGACGDGGHIIVKAWGTGSNISWEPGSGNVRTDTSGGTVVGGDIKLNACGSIFTTTTDFHGETPITSNICDGTKPDIPTTIDGDTVFKTNLWDLCGATTISTLLQKGSGTPSLTLTVNVGDSVHDTSTLSGATGDAGGTVIYTYYTDSNCTQNPVTAGTKTVVNGVVPNSDDATFNSAGTFYWKAVYSGDANNQGSSSACNEVLTVSTVNAPDLTVTKTNDVSGTVALGGSWKWTLTANNVGNAAASFTNGQVILKDDLPNSNIGYTGVSETNLSGITGTILCSIDGASTLTCTASGAVTIAATTGSFKVEFTATPTAVGTFTNPRVEGTCAVDPNNNVTESNEGNDTCGNTVTIPAPDLTVTKTNDVSGTVALGGSWKWTLTANNVGNAAASFTNGQVILKDDLPNSNIGYTGVSETDLSGITGTILCSIDGSSTLTCTASGAVTIAATTGSFKVEFTATPTAVGTFTNPRVEGVCKVDPGLNVTESNEGNDTCGNTVTVPAPDLTVTKTNDVSGTVALGGSWKWTLTANNVGNGAASFSNGQVILKDDLPNSNIGYTGVTETDLSGITGTILCSIDGSSTLTCTASGAVTIAATTGSFKVEFTATPTAAGTFTNPRVEGVCKVDPGLNVTESNEGNDTCGNTVTVPAPDLTVTKTNDVSGTVALGGSWKWTLTANNVGNGAASFSNGQVILKDDLPNSNIGYTGVSETDLSGITGTILCSIDGASTLTCTASGAVTIAATTGSFKVEFTATPTAAGTFTNPRVEGVCKVDPGLNVTESNEGNDTCGNTVTVPAPDLTVTKTNDVSGTVALGGSWKWTLTANNVGNGAASFSNGQVILKDDLPNSNIGYTGVSETDLSGITGTILCSIDGSSTLTCTASGAVTIAATTGSFKVEFTATPTAAGTFTNPRVEGVCKVDPGLNVTESNEGNDTCGNTVTVPAPDLTVTKTNDVSGTVALGGSWKWTLTANNVGNAAASFTNGQVILKDDLPNSNIGYTGVTETDLSGITGTILCSIDGSSTLTCTASGAVTIAATTGSFKVEFTATPTAAGTFTNPRVEGVCKVDPGLNVTESNEGNDTCGNTVTVPAPDLTVTKTNDVSGTVALGGSWKWTLTANNVGNGAASFSNGQVILKDDLPNSNIGYTGVSETDLSGITGTILCSIDGASTLTCTASGAVTIAATTGSFKVEFTATPTAAGTFTNPRVEGVCKVDPGLNVTESNEGNNTCGNTVTVGRVDPGTFTTDIHNGSHNVVTSVPVGTTVHDKATLTANGGLPVPTGTVTFSWFTNGTCTPDATQTSSAFTLVSGVVDGTTFTQTPAAFGSFAFQANYGGDSVYNSKTGPCEPLTVNKIDPTSVTTVIHNAAHSPVIVVTTGTTVHDSATVTGSLGTPTGNVTFKWFTNGNCTGDATATSSPFTLVSGTVDGTTFPQTPNSIGSFGFRATYNGDNVYNPKTGDCELLSVVSAAVDTTISTSLSGGGQTGALIIVPLNTPITDQAGLSGNTGNAGGTVTYTVFTDSGCSNVFASAGVKTVTNGSVPASNAVSFSQTGIYYWQAEYSGDANNNPSISTCTQEQTTVYRILVKLTPTKDSFVKSEDSNTNEGANRRLRLAALNGSCLLTAPTKKGKKVTTLVSIPALCSGTERVVTAFNVSGLNVTGLIKAQLVFYVATNNGGWGGGQAVEVRRLQRTWAEGGGKNPDLSTGLITRGSGSGVTWSCSTDTNINNTSATCSGASLWSGADTQMAAPTAPAVLHTDLSSGDIVWDVTTDVLGGEAAITNGWIVKKVNESQTGGEVLYYSKEGATAINNMNTAPRLILYYQ